MTLCRLLRLIITAALLTSPHVTLAQDHVEESLACFEEWHSSGGVGPSVCKGAISVEETVIRWDEFSPATVDAILDGLERLAIGSPDQRVRISATVSLMTPGKTSLGPDRTRPGIVQRAGRLYQASPPRDVKNTILRAMDRLGERGQAVSFLTVVAQEDPEFDRGAEWPLALVAVTRLANMGSEGQAALQQLKLSGDVRNPQARRFLNLPSQR